MAGVKDKGRRERVWCVVSEHDALAAWSVEPARPFAPCDFVLLAGGAARVCAALAMQWRSWEVHWSCQLGPMRKLGPHEESRFCLLSRLY